MDTPSNCLKPQSEALGYSYSVALSASNPFVLHQSAKSSQVLNKKSQRWWLKPWNPAEKGSATLWKLWNYETLHVEAVEELAPTQSKATGTVRSSESRNWVLHTRRIGSYCVLDCSCSFVVLFWTVSPRLEAAGQEPRSFTWTPAETPRPSDMHRVIKSKVLGTKSSQEKTQHQNTIATSEWW